jgi:uncharacterized protein YjdB
MKKNLLLASIIVGVLILGVITSCKKDNPKPTGLSGITLIKDTLKINVGDTRSINLTLTPSNFDKTALVWHSSDNTIVSVDNNGLLTAISEGEAIITVTNQTATITSVCLVSVLPKLKGIALSKDTIQINAGDVKTVNVTLTPLTSDKSTLVWKSSDTTILSVSNGGIITAKKPGGVIVSVRNQNGTLTAFCLVSVLPKLKGIALTKDTVQMNAGDVKSINVTLTPLNSDKSTLVWQSSDTTILSVNNTGVVTAKKQGVAIVSVRNQDATLTAFCLVSVAPKIDDLTIGLIAYYPFNNSGLDQSGHGNNGTVYNISSVPDRHGNLNAAYHFDGYTSYITVPDNPQLRLSNTDFTLSAWIKLETYNTYYGSVIFGKRYTGLNNGWTMTVGGQAASPIGSINFGPGGGAINATGSSIISLNQWVMVTCIYTLATQQLSIYVNGVLDVTATNILPANSSITALMYIGKDDPSVPANGYFFQGSMDEMRIYNRAINNTELQNLYTNY